MPVKRFLKSQTSRSSRCLLLAVGAAERMVEILDTPISRIPDAPALPPPPPP